MDLALRSVQSTDHRDKAKSIDKITFIEYVNLPGIVCDRFHSLASKGTQEGRIYEEDFIELFGNFVTLKMNLTIGPDDKKDQIYILLNSTYKYQIIIHDPEFFIYNENPAAIPMTTTYFDPRSDNTSYFYHLVLTEVMMIIWMMMVMMLDLVMIGTCLTKLR